MTRNDELQTTRDTIRQVFELVGIQTVVFVDDYSETSDTADVEGIIGLIALALRSPVGADKLRTVLPEIPFEFDDVWKLKLREQWTALNHLTRQALVTASCEMVPDLQLDATSPSLLRDFMPPEIETLELTPRSWLQSQDVLMSKASDITGVLCLFDQDLQFSGIPGITVGVDLLKAVLAKRNERRVICALLTRTVGAQNESECSRALTQEYGLRPEDFLVISKQRLSDEPMGFAHSLKKAALNYFRDSLTGTVKRLAMESNDEAARESQALDVEDFEHMVLRSSEREGLWEAETLFRVFEIFRRVAFQQHAYRSDNRDRLNQSISLIRSLRSVGSVSAKGPGASAGRSRVRRLDLYDTDTMVNQTHRPLELGDIFEVWSSDTPESQGLRDKYVLLAQPCDLMVRSDGRRTAHGAFLVHVVVPATKGQIPHQSVSFPLEYFDPSSDATWYAIFKQAYQVSTEVLDLCVLNSDGRCMIDLSAAVPTDFHHSWQQRCTELQSSYRSHASHVGKILSGIEKLDPDLVSRPYLDEALKAKLTRSMLDPQFDYEPCGVFRFGIRRCGRYRQPGATALLSQFVAFLSRNASEPDFVK